MIADKCLVIFSGGQDSTTALFWALKNFKEVSALTFDYSQKHRIELDSAFRIAEMAGVPHAAVAVGPILEGKSPLTNSREQLETYPDYDSMQKVIGDRVELTFVPMRNALFLVLAANRAHCAGISHLVTGVCEADGANYPDCRAPFIKAAQNMIAHALDVIPQMTIWAPLIDLKKSDSVKLALTLPGCYQALAYSHTAYDGKYPPTGKDHASVLRAHGFEEAGVPDPLVLRAWAENRMELPKTKNYELARGIERKRIIGQSGVNHMLYEMERRMIEDHLP